MARDHAVDEADAVRLRASTISPVRIISVALVRPTMRGRRYIPPSAGTQPILTQTSPKRARSEARRKSDATASSQPAPTGFSMLRMARIGRWKVA